MLLVLVILERFMKLLNRLNGAILLLALSLISDHLFWWLNGKNMFGEAMRLVLITVYKYRPTFQREGLLI